MIGALIVLLVMAIGVTVWRYGVAVDTGQAALAEAQVEIAAQEARAALAYKGGLVDAYGGDKDPADLRAIARVETDFHRALTGAREGLDDADEQRKVDGFIAADEALDAAFLKRVEPVAGTPRFDEGVKPYAAALERSPSVWTASRTPSRRRRWRGPRRRARKRIGRRRSRSSPAVWRWFWRSWSRSTAAAWCAACSGESTVSSGQIDQQVEQIEQIRSTAAELAGAAGAMRAAASHTASATSEQSAAIAEAASTIEELNATAASIADNARAGSTRGGADRRHDARHAGAGRGDLRALADAG